MQPSPAKAHQQIRLTTLRDGRPEKGVQVSIFRYGPGSGEESAPRFVLTSDRDGRVFSPKLAPGYYHLHATSAKKLEADLDLDVSPPEGASEFSMNLAPNPFPTREELIAKAEQSAVADRLTGFHGVVYDPTGAVIPRASVEVVRRGTEGKERVAQLASGNAGEFAAKLSNGSYVAIFSSPGFQMRYVAFDVTAEGSSGLKITLKIGSGC